MEFYRVNKELGNLINDNVRKLESIFPSAVKDGEVDFEELKELLGNFKEVDKEKYEMNWVGKKEAKKIALSPLSGKTLRYIEGNGKNEYNTENIYIEGDNLEVLKLLQNSYYGKVKMIYIDPPYNTGGDFIYSDNFKEYKCDIEILEGYRNEYGERLVKNMKTSSHYHSKWLSMIYSRILLCKNLLKDDGVIFISIDDNEFDNMKKICNEVFGNDNFVGNITWEKRTKCQNTKTAREFLQSKVEYILVYKKNNEKMHFKLDITGTKEYDLNDEYGEYREKSIEEMSNIGMRGRDTMVFPILGVYPKIGNQWKIGSEQVEFFKERNDLFIKDGKPFIKIRPYDEVNEIFKPFWSHFFDKDAYGTAELGKSELSDLLCTKEHGFETVKPVKLIKKLISHIKLNSNEDDIVLDFFSGSATTAHAIMQLNSDDGGKRKYIMVQIPEVIDEKSEAYKSGYKNICEIGKERIRRAGEKILQENIDKENIDNLDIGFKVFRVENSNIRWKNQQLEENDQFKFDLGGKSIDDNNFMYQFKFELDGRSIDDIDFVQDTKDIDVVYELLLRHYGIPLTAKIDKLDFIGDRTYAIQESIIVCLETQITKDIIDKIAELEPVKVIFRDSAFGDDISLKQNSVHRLNVLIEKNNKNTTHVVEFI